MERLPLALTAGDLLELGEGVSRRGVAVEQAEREALRVPLEQALAVTTAEAVALPEQGAVGLPVELPARPLLALADGVLPASKEREGRGERVEVGLGLRVGEARGERLEEREAAAERLELGEGEAAALALELALKVAALAEGVEEKVEFRVMWVARAELEGHGVELEVRTEVGEETREVVGRGVKVESADCLLDIVEAGETELMEIVPNGVAVGDCKPLALILLSTLSLGHRVAMDVGV